MEKKNSPFSNVLMVIFAIVVLVRIVMLMSRDSGGNSAHATWNNSYLIWSIFLFCAIVGMLIYNGVKKKE